MLLVAQWVSRRFQAVQNEGDGRGGSTSTHGSMGGSLRAEEEV